MILSKWEILETDTYSFTLHGHLHQVIQHFYKLHKILSLIESCGVEIQLINKINHDYRFGTQMHGHKAALVWQKSDLTMD